MSILKQPHNNKPREIVFKGEKFYRFPIQTHTIDVGEDIIPIIKNEIKDLDFDEAVLLIAESALSASQKRIFKFSEIKFGFWAKFLSKFVTKTPAGIGLGTPQTMQLAINEVGLVRIIFAAAVSALSRPFVKGLFYKLVGEKARGIDGPTANTIPPYNEYASLIPANISEFVKKAEEEIGRKLKIIIIDANDIGVNILDARNKDEEELAQALAFDNPLGQGSESTPFLLCTKVDLFQ